jgi:two-component system sensor kinase FixL
VLEKANNMRPSELVRELATIAPGASADELLHRLLASLVAILNARRAYVTEIVNDRVSRVVAAWEDDERGPTREYNVTGTPCAAVIKHGVQVVECGLQDHFSIADSSLGHGCDSFVGSPIVNHQGERIGQLCVFGAGPLADPEMASALTSMAAVRISAELEHREQEERLRHQQQQLEVLLGNLPGMAYRCDADEHRRVRFASQGCRELTGYTSGECANGLLDWTDLVHTEDRLRVRQEVSRALLEQRSFELQYRIVTRDGEQKWVWDRAGGIYDDNGRVRSIEGFISDATALKESQAALARSEAYSSAIVATAAEGIITLDAHGRIQSFNWAAEKMFGYKAKEVLGKDVHLLMPEPYRDRHTEYVDNYVRTGESTIIGTGREVLAQRKDGSTFPIHLAASEIELDGERCFTGMIRDISDQKAAEESIKVAERRFRAVFDQRLQLVGILSPDGVVLEANHRSLAFAGLHRDAVIGRHFWDAPWWRHSTELQQRIRAAIEAASRGETTRFEASSPRVDGELATLDLSIRPVTDKEGRIKSLVTESHDVTEHKRAEEEAKQHRARIAHVTRLSTLGEMAAGIAHEINQPLTAISLFAQAGKRLVEVGDLEKIEEVCDKLTEHSLRAADVVERMQAMARQGESVKETIDCNQLIESAVKLAESEARINDIEVHFDKGARLPPVSADVVQIQQVALNLLRNGMEAMLPSGDRKDPTVRISTRLAKDGQIVVTVSDNGRGVPADRIDKLFTPFSTTKKSGMGMGLSISQAIVRAHGGHIDFRNNDGGGATFWFTLPATRREMQDEQRADSICRR